SGGQQQRVALARALIVEPKVLLLDEPLSNLDAHLRDDMRELILDLQTQFRTTTILVTHDQQEAVMMGDRIALLFAGRLRQVDTPSAFYRRPVDLQTARFFGGVNFISGQRRGEVVETPIGPLPAPAGCGDGSHSRCTVTVRPEDLRLDAPGGIRVPGVVVSTVYLGTHARFKVRAGETLLIVEDDAALAERIGPGAQVQVTIPPDRLWLLPAGE
ncbi:MAG: ABC transporter ATP-binding protein, partial [Anaerolineae bacterium]|nr:ABC transporter ATP-binding protein [Anaerolineae bacterium]